MVSGPPCPPHSSIGKRLGEEDCRSEVFYVCLRWVVRRAWRSKRFKFFVLENPLGIEKRRRGDAESFADKVIGLLRLDLPPSWAVHTNKLNLSECGVAAARPRFFIIGTCETMRATAQQRRWLAAPPRTPPAPPLLEFLTPLAAPEDWGTLTFHQQINVLTYLERFHRYSSANIFTLSPMLGLSRFNSKS